VIVDVRVAGLLKAVRVPEPAIGEVRTQLLDADEAGGTNPMQRQEAGFAPAVAAAEKADLGIEVASGFGEARRQIP
jgi:hypothetical protein